MMGICKSFAGAVLLATAVGLMGCGGDSGVPQDIDAGNPEVENNNCTSGSACKQVTVNGQTWMAENLNIPTDGGSWCYENSADSCSKYGRLYDWAAAMKIDSSYNKAKWNDGGVKHQGICPDGWHLPSREDWEALVAFGGGEFDAGKKLKSTRGWLNNGNGTNDLKFSALPGGDRHTAGYFRNVGNTGGWWTSTEHATNVDNAYNRNMYDYKDQVFENFDFKNAGFSVRCVKN